MEINKAEIEKQARQELYDEQRRRAVDQAKVKLTAKKWWKLPFKIIIVRR